MTNYKIGDIIYRYSDMEHRIHEGKVLFVNYAGVDFPDINYEVEIECYGEKKALFLDEDEIISTDLL